MNIATQRKSYDLFVFCYNYGTYTMIAVYMLAIQCGTDFKDSVFGRNPFSVTLVAKNSVFKVCAALNSLHIYRNHGALLIVVTKHKKDRNSFSLGYVVHYSILFSSSKTLAAYQNRTKLKSTILLLTLFHQHLYYNIIYHCVKCPNQYRNQGAQRCKNALFIHSFQYIHKSLVNQFSGKFSFYY